VTESPITTPTAPPESPGNAERPECVQVLHDAFPLGHLGTRNGCLETLISSQNPCVSAERFETPEDVAGHSRTPPDAVESHHKSHRPALVHLGGLTIVIGGPR
jgi:hypothetical protein